jgi:hypothetical protein
MTALLHGCAVILDGYLAQVIVVMHFPTRLKGDPCTGLWCPGPTTLRNPQTINLFALLCLSMTIPPLPEDDARF